MINFGKLYIFHLRNSKKVILISTIGLICAIAIVSSSLLYVDATKGDIANTLLNANPNHQNYDINIEMSYQNPKENTFKISNELNNITTSLLDKANLHVFSHLEMTYMIQKLETPQNYYWENNGSNSILNLSFSIVQLNDALRNDLHAFTSQNSSLPKRNASIQQAFALESFFDSPKRLSYIYYQTHHLLDLKNSSIIPIFQDSLKPTTDYFNITGLGKVMQPSTYNPEINVYTPHYYNSSYPALSKVWAHLKGPFLVLFVNNLTRYTEKYIPSINGVYNRQIMAFGGLNIDFKKVDPLAIASKTEALSKFANSLQTQILNSHFYQNLKNYQYFMNVGFTSLSTYRQMENASNQIIFNMWLYSIPVVIIAILTVFFSFGLIYKQVIRYISVLKTRGASAYFILIFELIDFITLLLISVIAGTLAGFPVASLVTKTDFLLSFNRNSNYNIINTFANNIGSILGTIFIFSIIISFLANLQRTFKLATISIAETDRPTENSEPYWKRHYLDIILFLYGLISYSIFIYLLNTRGQSINSIINLIMTLSLPSPFILVIGAILLFNRITPPVLNWLGEILWRLRGDLLALSFKNVIRHRQASTRAIMIIASLLTFLIVFYSLPYSQVAYQQQTSLYENGAEGNIVITPVPIFRVKTINQQIHNVSRILSSNFSNSLVAFSPYFTVTTSDNGTFGPEQILFINASSYVQASSVNHFNVGLQSANSLQQDLHTLQENKDSVLMNKAAFQSQLLSLNENVTLKNSYGFQSTYQIVDSFSQWPSTTRFSWDTSTWIIADMHLLLHSPQKDLTKTFYTAINSMGFYLKFKPGVNRTAIAHDISVLTGFTTEISNFKPQSWDVFNSIILTFQIGQINTDVIMSLAIGVTILIMFAYMQLNDRKREIYTELALGMKIKQTSLLFFIESIIILLSSILIGTFLGTFFVQIVAIYMTRGTQYPSYNVIIPWDLVFQTYLGFIILALLSAILPAYFITKQDISKSFITDV